jgi:hypothetical protein
VTWEGFTRLCKKMHTVILCEWGFCGLGRLTAGIFGYEPRHNYVLDSDCVEADVCMVRLFVPKYWKVLHLYRYVFYNV